MKAVTKTLLLGTTLVLAAAGGLYVQIAGQPRLESLVCDDPTAIRIAQKIRACGQSRFWETTALHKVEHAIARDTDWNIWKRIDRHSTTRELVAQCKARGFTSLHGECKATAVLLAGVAEQLGIHWRICHRPGRRWTSKGHAWCEVQLDGVWYSIAAKADDESTFPAEAAPQLSTACGELAPGHNDALSDWVKFTSIPL